MIDWHSHHTAPELVKDLAQVTGRSPKIDDYDSPDFSRRVKEMDKAGIDIQLVCQGAGIDAGQLPESDAMDFVRKSNDVLADRIAVAPDRLMGIIALSLRHIENSVREIERNVTRGFHAVLLYPRVGGEMMVDRIELDPIFKKISELRLPIFLHGSTTVRDPSLRQLEDEGAGVTYSVLADANVSECVVRMIASGLFDRHPTLRVVIRSGGGGIPLLLNRLFWKHKGPQGEQRYSDILLKHFLIDTASVSTPNLRFLLETMGEERVVFGSDYCGGLGPLEKGLIAVEGQQDPGRVKLLTEKNSQHLLGL